MRKTYRLLRRGSALFYAATTLAVVAMATALKIDPSDFDFGWCPDNALVSTEFIVKNTSPDIIPLTAVQPTCGCTASSFTPGDLSSNQETKIGLTFNTRGYGGSAFHKTAKVRAGTGDVEYTVTLLGHVTNPVAVVVPQETGIASFEPETAENKKSIAIQNKSAEEVSLEMVQKPAEWAKIKWHNKPIPAGQTGLIDVSVDKPYDAARNTSATFMAKGKSATHRFTIAVRTGPPATTTMPSRIQPAPAPVSPSANENPGTVKPPKPAPTSSPSK